MNVHHRRLKRRCSRGCGFAESPNKEKRTSNAWVVVNEWVGCVETSRGLCGRRLLHVEVAGGKIEGRVRKKSGGGPEDFLAIYIC